MGTVNILQAGGIVAGDRVGRRPHSTVIEKLTLAVVLTVGSVVAGLILDHPHALAACNPYSTVCGYFTGSNTVQAWCNVLPDPTIKWSYDGYSNCGGTSSMYGVTDANTFTGNMADYLWGTSGNAGYNRNANVGAAFLIDDMLGIDKYTTNPNQGINDARNNFNKWQGFINDLAAPGHQCAYKWAPTCPGVSSFGINWAYTSPDFCSYPNSVVFSSAYDAGPPSDTGPNDATLWTTNAGDCQYAYSHSKPEIVFYWNGGANSFRMGSQCGNAEDITNPLIDNPPTGTIQVTCNAGAGDYTANLSFGDKDGWTQGYIATGGHATGPPGSGSPQTFTIPASWTNPYVAQSVQLWVKDVGLFGDQQYHNVATATTRVPCATFGCGGLNVTPMPLDPYMTNYTVSVSVTSSVKNPQVPDPNMLVQITPPSGGAGYSSGQVPAFNTVTGTSTATFTIPGPAKVTGMYAVAWQLTSNGTDIQTCSGSFPVVYLPYFDIYGGDAIVGDGPTYTAGTNVTSCTAPPNSGSGIFSWYDSNGLLAGGEGAQYAVQTLAQIEDFASAQDSASPSPTGLSFANSGLPANEFNPSQGLFGGHLGLLAINNQACDFTSGLYNPTPGALVNPPSTINLSQDLTIFASGNVYISHDIDYANADLGWSNVNQIPEFKLVVVGGNIYIGSGVQNLDGLYVAEPSGGVGGTIYTCAKGNGSPWDPTVDYPTYYAACNTPLTVNGAFAANQVQLLRTSGSVGQPGEPAEVFNYTPELWLPRNNGPPSNNYAAVSGLPPVL